MITIEDGIVSLTRDGRNRLSMSVSLGCSDWVVLSGPNGCGKTTLLDILAGYRLLDSGRLDLGHVKRPISYAVQEANSGLLPWRTILANVCLPAELSQIQSAQSQSTAKHLLQSFGLWERRHEYPYALSGGEKQLVNLIRSIATPSMLCLLDEPFASLHQAVRAEARIRVAEYARGKTVVLVTHDPNDLALVEGRYLTIRDGVLSEISRCDATKVLQHAIR